MNKHHDMNEWAATEARRALASSTDVISSGAETGKILDAIEAIWTQPYDADRVSELLEICYANRTQKGRDEAFTYLKNVGAGLSDLVSMSAYVDAELDKAIKALGG